MAVKVTRTFTATARGAGKPDYTREVSSALERRGVRLGYKQTLKTFGLVHSNEASPYSWVGAVLASGATSHFIDNETGLATPFTIPQGYTLSIIEAAHASDKDVELWGYMDGFLATGMGIVSGGQTVLENRVIGFTTAMLDPTGATSHTIDVVLTNIGGGDLKGGFVIIAILEEVGTPPMPTTKIVRCKFCEYKETVPLETSQWICPKCGQLNIYYDLSKFRGMP